jgi:hypothetical protein
MIDLLLLLLWQRWTVDQCLAHPYLSEIIKEFPDDEVRSFINIV